MLIEDMTLGGILKTKVYREPSVVCVNSWQRGSAFTMRLLTFLFRLNMKAQSKIQVPSVDYFAARHTHEED